MADGRYKILCVDDDPGVQRLLARVLDTSEFAARVVSSAAEFRKAAAEEPPDACVVDLDLPDERGLNLLGCAAPTIVLTGSGAVDDAVAAMKLGAVDYLRKPVEPEKLLVALRNAIELSAGRRTIQRLRSDLPELCAPEHLVGGSELMEGLRRLIRRAAAGDVSVLVTGETGTGKELVARSIHYTSPRRQGPFVDVNCAALTESLLESELFGHERGAFTGAAERRAGLFEQARGGTVFLDEIGDMPPSTQAKILRVLQERTLRRVGGGEPVSVDVRVISATHRDLARSVGDRTFREDLFYRINTLTVEVPPLRERPSDLSELAGFFLLRAVRRSGGRPRRWSAAALERLREHAWPGNVRELENAVERAVVLCDGEEILPEHLPAPMRAGAPGAAATLVEAVEQMERAMILDALAKHGGVKARAARALGITERVIGYKMKALGIESAS